MTDVEFADEILERLRERDPRFHGKAYVFLLSALHRVMDRLEEPRHISGAELAESARGLALERYGLLARTVLGYWGIHSTEDLGKVVFTLVDAGILVAEPDDDPMDFQGLFDFEEAFEREYPWKVES
jgi:uncharacterized repeat protein (TIGR04138 family)